MRVHHFEVANDMKFLSVGLEPSDQTKGTLNTPTLVWQYSQNTDPIFRGGRNLLVDEEEGEDSWKMPVAQAPHCFKCPATQPISRVFMIQRMDLATICSDVDRAETRCGRRRRDRATFICGLKEPTFLEY